MEMSLIIRTTDNHTNAPHRQICFVALKTGDEDSGGYLDDSLLGDGAGPALVYVKPLLHRKAAAVGLETLHQQVVDSSKVVVTLVLERLDTGRDKPC